MARLVTRAVVAGLLMAGVWASPAQAQPDSPPLVDIDADPIRCWWYADRGAIQVGEHVTLTLTCAVVETEAARVVVDRSRLDPSVLTLPPFDVTGGTQPADTVTGSRRFFQYAYVLTLINDNAIGRDLLVPELPLSYRIESRTAGTGALEGRDQTYELPAIPLRLISLVATDATDIREVAHGGFEAIEARALRARLLRLGALVAFAVAALLAVMAFRRAFAGSQAATQAAPRLPERAVITSAAGRLAEARAALQRDARDEAAAGRALEALRVIGVYALGGVATQMVGEHGTAAEPGQIAVRSGWLGGRHALVSASTTGAAVRAHLARLPGDAASERLKLEALADALTRLTARRYGTDAGDDAAALDGSIGLALGLAGDLAREQSWIARQQRAAKDQIAAFGARVWTR
ncbi:MAG: hypothetical protein Q8L86_00680 [Vicinamibacterales bacterium]|nr:hypothetical protein [Vicinamibacterales bacterium]